MPISLNFAEQEKTKMNKLSQNLSLFLAIFKKTTLSSAQAPINKYRQDSSVFQRFWMGGIYAPGEHCQCPEA